MSIAANPMPSTFLSPHIEALYAGIDWVGLSLPRDAEGREQWDAVCREQLESIAEEGEKLETWGMEGYRGLRAGGSFWGVRDDGSYCRLSGQRANDRFDRVYRADCHCSRLDLQVTVRLRSEDTKLGEAHEAESLSANELLPCSRRRKIWHISGNDGGYTLYIGSLHSPRHGYIYNKDVQSGRPEYARCWRYEVRNKDPFADPLALHLRYGVSNRAEACGQLVAAWFRERGLILPWLTMDYALILPLEQEIPPEADRKIAWLHGQVRPALSWLIKNGHRAAALEALGAEFVHWTRHDQADEYIWRFPDE
jgi:hypothetical protein